MDVKMDVVNDKVDRCLVGLYGPPDHPENGLTVKVDRLEQIERKRSKVIWGLVLGVLGLLTKTVWAALGW